MKLEKVLLAHAGRLATLTTPALYVRDVVKAVQERYGFVRVPTTPAELLPELGQPVMFEHGKFQHGEQTIVIHQLQFYPKAVVVQTPSNTDESDLVLDDLFVAGRDRGWLAHSIGARLYMSQLEIRLDSTLDAAFPAGQQLGNRLVQALASYGFRSPPPRLNGFVMQPDPQKMQIPGDLRIERREGVSYDDNLYWSQAPVRTADHLAMLDEFDRALASADKPATA